jgi:hypothetical protein
MEAVANQVQMAQLAYVLRITLAANVNTAI